ncbi:unnamed protein product [Caenorhabditis nigoni]
MVHSRCTMPLAIPDADRKLSYECLKCVIQRLEVNFRFRLVQSLPKISYAEKAVPLYISKLSFSDEGFQLDGTKYRFGVLRQARDGPTPETVKSDNRKGGRPRDFDRFGFVKRSFSELSPGDLLIQDYTVINPERLITFESAEAKLVRDRRMLSDLEREKLELENVQENTAEENVLINEKIRCSKMSLDVSEFMFQCFQCQRDNIPSPYDMYIQLTKTSSDGTVYIERVKYGKTLMEARKYLLCKLLGDRQLAIKIKSLSFWVNLGDGLVIGFPEGIKLDVQKLTTSGNVSEVLKRAETIMEHPNRPFVCLESDTFKSEDAQNPKVREAETLALLNIYFVDYVALCREVPNRKILIILGQLVRPDHFVWIIDDLIETKGTLGTCYEFAVLRKEMEAKKVLQRIRERFENAVVGPRLVIIPLPSELQLDVSYAPYKIDSDNRRYSDILLYKIKMEVVQSPTN